MTKYQLILDIAGVIITNLSPTYWNEIAVLSSIPNEYLKTQFRQEVRELLWTGKISEDEYWNWFKSQCPTIQISEAKSMLYKHLRPLPAFDHIAKWSQSADIHLLSNHRKEWLGPLLEPLKPYVKSITISSTIGFCKPNPEIYEIVNSNLHSTQQVLFVDDQEKNIKPAKDLGWKTLVADKNGQWIEHIKQLLSPLSGSR
jgi:HAD superfamily hydrolase (TIGR01509 family)